MDQESIVSLVNSILDSRMKLLCQNCRNQHRQSNLSVYSYNISIPPNDHNKENKENRNRNNLQQLFSKCIKQENKIKSSKSQALELDLELFQADISAIRPISVISSPIIQKKRQNSTQFTKSTQFIKKDQSTYEKILKVKR